jgi:hypothetical protein
MSDVLIDFKMIRKDGRKFVCEMSFFEARLEAPYFAAAREAILRAANEMRDLESPPRQQPQPRPLW